MTWECHQCGQNHAVVPDQCVTCGTKPEFTENVWECPTCKRQGNPASAERCQGCGAEQDAGARFAVDPSRKLSVAEGRAATSGSLVKCAYCATLISPVDPVTGKPETMCMTCGASRTDADRRAIDQVIPDSEAGTYRAVVLEPNTKSGGDPQGHVPRGRASVQSVDDPGPPTYPDPVRLVRPVAIGAGVVLALFLLGWAFQSCRAREGIAQVTAKSWERTIGVDRQVVSTGSDWIDQVPSGAASTGCSPRQRGTHPVITGTHIVLVPVIDPCFNHSTRTDRVPYQVARGSKSCGGWGSKTQGKVSVRVCTGGWSQPTRTEYRSETRSVCVSGTRMESHVENTYRYDPTFADYCGWTRVSWEQVRVLTASGQADEPRWPDASGVGPSERQGRRGESYRVSFRHPEVTNRSDLEVAEFRWRQVRIGEPLRIAYRGGSVESILP